MSDQSLFEEAMAAALATKPEVPSSEIVNTEPQEPLSALEGTPTTPKVEKEPVEAEIASPEASAATIKPAEAATERFAPRLARLLEREAAAVAREQALKAQEADLAAFKAAKAELETAQARFRADPVSYLRKFAPEMKPADLAKALWYEELGEKAPVEHRVTRTELAAKQSVEELRAEFEKERAAALEAEKNRAMEAAHHQYVGALGSIAAAVPDAYPLVKAFSKQGPERVTQALYRMAQKHARATNGEVATPDQCAALLQKELAALQAIVSPSSSAPAQKPNETPSSLRNRHSSIQPNITDPSSEEEKFTAALEAARSASNRAGVNG
jgi:hypothetical protein